MTDFCLYEDVLQPKQSQYAIELSKQPRNRNCGCLDKLLGISHCQAAPVTVSAHPGKFRGQR